MQAEYHRTPCQIALTIMPHDSTHWNVRLIGWERPQLQWSWTSMHDYRLLLHSTPSFALNMAFFPAIFFGEVSLYVYLRRSSRAACETTCALHTQPSRRRIAGKRPRLHLVQFKKRKKRVEASMHTIDMCLWKWHGLARGFIFLTLVLSKVVKNSDFNDVIKI